jgi:hypothetical protein
MGAKATTSIQEHNVSEETMGELTLSDIHVMRTATVGGFAREALLALPPSSEPKCDGWTPLSEDSNEDVAESLVPCSTLRAGPSPRRIVAKRRCAPEKVRSCTAGQRFTCCLSRMQ